MQEWVCKLIDELERGMELTMSHISAQERRQRGGGHWVMTSPLGAEGALCDCSAPSNRECVYRENVGSKRAPSGGCGAPQGFEAHNHQEKGARPVCPPLGYLHP